VFGAMNVHRGVTRCIVALCLGAGLLGGCSTLPSLKNRSTSTALLDTDTIKLGRAISPLSFTVDNQATIIGGRNIGDEYFDATQGFVFVDLDVMAVGAVVKDVSHDFDRYWASGLSYPVDELLPPADPSLIAELASAASRIERDPAAAAHMDALRYSPLVRELIEGRLALEWATTRLVSDDPAKGLGLAAPGRLLPQKLNEIIGKPAAEVELVSAYFVPAAAGTAAFPQLRFGPTRQNFFGGSCVRLHRLVQFRSAFGNAEHRNRLCHRQPGIGVEHRSRVRQQHSR
jgi:hypothetical protein